MSTAPAANPLRSPDGAGEPPKILKILKVAAPPGQAGTREDCPSPVEDEEPHDGGLEAQDHSAAARRRRAQAAEIDKEYEERLAGLAQNLQALRREATPADPDPSIAPPLDGMALQRSIRSSDFDLPERGTNRLGAILPMGIACAVVATIAFSFAVGNRLASGPDESALRPELQLAMGPASVWEPVSGVSRSQSARGQKLAEAEPPNAVSGKRQPQGQLSDPVPMAIERPAEPAAPAQTPGGVPLTPALASPPASKEQPQPPPVDVMRPNAMDPNEIQLLFAQGQGFMAVGDLATARIVLRRAAEAGDLAAAFALAQCYDPKVLTNMRVRGVVPDIVEARRWYEIARQLGSVEAARHLEFLSP